MVFVACRHTITRVINPQSTRSKNATLACRGARRNPTPPVDNETEANSKRRVLAAVEASVFARLPRSPVNTNNGSCRRKAATTAELMNAPARVGEMSRAVSKGNETCT